MVFTWTLEMLINAVMICNMIVLGVQGLLDSLRDYQHMHGCKKISNANLKPIHSWNKVPIKLQKEVCQMTKGSSKELFQKLLKPEEVVKERERKSSHRGSATREFRGRYSQFRVITIYSYLGTTEYSKRETRHRYKRATSKILNVSDVVRKGMLLNCVMLSLTILV